MKNGTALPLLRLPWSSLAAVTLFFPREPTGGTWISANDAGVCLALINWHRIEREPKNDLRSRGLVVRELAGKSTRRMICSLLQSSGTGATTVSAIPRVALDRLRALCR